MGDATNTLQDIRTDILNLNFATPRGVFDVTGIDKAAFEKLLGLADFTVQLNMGFDTGASLNHAVFSTVPSTSVNRAITCTVNGKNLNLGTAGAGNGAVLFTDYKVTRNANGELLTEAPGVLANGVVPVWS